MRKKIKLVHPREARQKKVADNVPNQVSGNRKSLRNAVQGVNEPSSFEEALKKRSLDCIEAIVEGVMKIKYYPPKGIMRTGPSELSQFYTNSCNNSHIHETPISRERMKEAENKLKAFFKKHEAFRDSHQVHLKKTDNEPHPKGDIRKAYICPPADQLAEFMESLMDQANQMNVKWLDAKTNPGDAIQQDSEGNVIAQEHNLVPFYFRNDEEFQKFIECVRLTEKKSGISLLRFQPEDMPLHGQVLAGAVQFGVDLSGGGQGSNFDGWTVKLVQAGIKAKNKGGSKEDVARAIENKLRDIRGVDSQDYLTV